MRALRSSLVSHSTPEAELVAANLAVRTEGLPALDLWTKVSGKQIILNLQEDNQAAIQIIRNGRNPTLRHVNRTHRVSADWLTEVFRKDKQTRLLYCKTEDQAADIFTKPFPSAAKWNVALRGINMLGPSFLKAPPKLSHKGRLTTTVAKRINCSSKSS